MRLTDRDRRMSHQHHAVVSHGQPTTTPKQKSKSGFAFSHDAAVHLLGIKVFRDAQEKNDLTKSSSSKSSNSTSPATVALSTMTYALQ
ncbi:hypothetical protein LSAT2_028049 [Lamellibrachia satsuma]|nr:hypothetical protein LSAT2_028049 [Lamellibrachia satsuma]